MALLPFPTPSPVTCLRALTDLRQRLDANDLQLFAFTICIASANNFHTTAVFTVEQQEAAAAASAQVHDSGGTSNDAGLADGDPHSDTGSQCSGSDVCQPTSKMNPTVASTSANRTQPEAFIKVFSILELADMILAKLPRDDLMFRVQLTCRTLHDAMQRSTSVQRRFFRVSELLDELQHLPLKKTVGVVWEPRCAWYPPSYRMSRLSVEAHHLRDFLVLANPHGAVSPFLAQPPVTVILVKYELPYAAPYNIYLEVNSGITLVHVAIAIQLLRVWAHGKYGLDRGTFAVEDHWDFALLDSTVHFTPREGSCFEAWTPLIKLLHEQIPPIIAGETPVNQASKAFNALGDRLHSIRPQHLGAE